MNLSALLRCCAVTLFGLTSCPQAAVNDVFPGDYVALNSGDVGVAAYAYDRKADGPFRNGSRTADNHFSQSCTAIRRFDDPRAGN